MSHLDAIELIYTDADGQRHTQPLADLTTVGVLIDADTGDDMELTGWRFTAGEDFIVVRGGLVTNFPGLPVFDLDVLDADIVTVGDVEYAAEMLERILDHPSAAQSLAEDVDDLTAFVRGHADPATIDTLVPATNV